MRNPGPFRDQCQHNTWYFLPWHRMYLYWFERIVRSIIQTLHEVDEQIKACGERLLFVRKRWRSQGMLV